MKPSLVSFLIAGACCTGSPTALPAQQAAQGASYFNQSEDFTYGNNNNKKGRFLYVIEKKCDNEQGQRMPTGLVDLTICPAGATTLRVAFTSANIKLDDDYKLVLRPDCFGGTEELKLSGTTGLTLKKRGHNEGPITGNFVYQVQKNGPGELKIGYIIIKKDEDANQACVHYLTIPYSISGMTDPLLETCNNALQAFRANKLPAIPQLQAIAKNNPNAPCSDEIAPILADYAKYEQIALAAATPMNCAKMKTLAAQYPANGHFKAEVDALLKKCTVAPPPPPEPGDPPDLTAWNQIKNSANCRDFEQFAADYPTSQYAPEAMRLFRKCSNIIVQEKRIGNFERHFTLENVTRPHYKDLSLDYGLDIRAEALLTSNEFTAVLEAPGEYLVRIRDAMDKDTLLRINSSFSASVAMLPDSSGYFVKINGENPPYQVTLEDLATGENVTLRNALKNAQDTALILFGELSGRKLTGQYIVKVKGAQSPATIEAGILHGPPKDSGFTRIILLLLGLLFACGVIYLVFFLIGRKKRRNKPIYTNYDAAN